MGEMLKANPVKIKTQQIAMQMKYLLVTQKIKVDCILTDFFPSFLKHISKIKTEKI